MGFNRLPNFHVSFIHRGVDIISVAKLYIIHCMLEMIPVFIKSLTQDSIFKSYRGINDRKDDNKLEDVRGLYKYLITHPLIANKAHP